MIIENIHKQRVALDALIQYAQLNLPNHRAILKIRFAKAWLGTFLAELGMQSPYPIAHTINKIPPPTDIFTGTTNIAENELDAINTLREKLQTHITKTKTLPDTLETTAAIINLQEARFLLGFSLEELRKK